jgi:hypothetical protein
MKILYLAFMFSFSTFAQVNPVPAQPICPVCPTCPNVCPEEKQSSATNRDESFGTLMGGFQFVNTWVPGKVTGSYTQILNRRFSLELEYAISKRDVDIVGFDIGELEEDRYTFFLKYYIGNSFNLSLGPYISQLSLTLDDKITNAAGGRINEKAEISLIGVSLNIGNRWQFNNGITFGIDWMRINQPTGTYKVSERIFDDVDDEDRDQVTRTGRFFKSFPAFTFFGVNLGYTF